MSETLGTEAAGRIVARALEEAAKRGQQIAVAVVDDRGELLYFARTQMEPTEDQWEETLTADASSYVRMAINKAYTSAVLRRDTRALKTLNEQKNRTLLDYGNPRFTTMIGGVHIKSRHGTSLGAVGVAGFTEEGDEEVAVIAISAM